MSRQSSRSGIFPPINWRRRMSRFAIDVVMVLLTRAALAAPTNSAPVLTTKTNRNEVSESVEFNPQLIRSVYKPRVSRDPFLKPGLTDGSGASRLAMTSHGTFRLQAILWSPTNPSAVVNDQFLSLAKSVILSTASGNVEVKAVEIGRDRVVLDVAGQRVELKLNPEQPMGGPPE